MSLVTILLTVGVVLLALSGFIIFKVYQRVKNQPVG